MNALALWIPGTLLLVVATVLLATDRVELGIGVALIGIAVALETVGTWMWIRQRRPRIK